MNEPTAGSLDDRESLPETLAQLAALRGVERKEMLGTPIPEQVWAKEFITPDTFDPGERLGQYRMIRELGRGGMSVVYLAKDERLQRDVAIKVVTRRHAVTNIQSNFREEQLLAEVEHEHIARLYEVGALDDGRSYLVMEYVDGVPITSFCAGLRDVEEHLRLFVMVCEAVSFAHKVPIIHRDLKPSNILVTKNGIPKLIDFGIAKLLKAGTPADITEEPRPMTLDYASPEQILGERLTTATDVYSLGAVLYELLAGERPFRLTDLTLPELVRTVRESSPRLPSKVVSNAPTGAAFPLGPEAWSRRLKGDVDNIVMNALRREPAERYSSVEAFAGDLRLHLAGFPVNATKGGVKYRTAKFVRRQKGVVAAAALLLITLGAGAGTTLWQYRKARSHLADVRRFANQFLFEFHDKIEYLPGSTDARQFVVKRGLEYLEIVRREGVRDPVFLNELARAYLKIAGIQGGYNLRSLGDVAGSLRSCDSAVTLSRELLAASRNSDLAEATLAAAVLERGRRQMALGNTSDALKSFEEAFGLDQDRLRKSPSDLERLRNVSVSADELGSAYANLGDLPRARTFFEQALEVSERTYSQRTADWKAGRDVAISHSRLADLYVRLGQWEEASRRYKLSSDMREILAQTFPVNAQAQRDVVVGYAKPLDGQIAHGDLETARIGVCRIVAITERLMATDPKDTQARRDVSGAHAFLGKLLSWSGNWGAASREYERALEIRRQLASLSPDDWRMKGYVAYSLTDVGNAMNELREPEKARRYLREALEVRQEMVLKDPNNLPARRELSLLFEKLGMLELSVGGRTADAAKALGFAFQQHQEIARTEKTSEDVHAELARIQGNYARTLTGPEASQHSAAAITWFRKAAKSPAQSVDVLHDYARLVLVLNPPALQGADEAVRAAEQVVRLTKASNPAMVHTLALAYRAAGDADKARAGEMQERELRQRSQLDRASMCH